MKIYILKGESVYNDYDVDNDEFSLACFFRFWTIYCGDYKTS